jgi:hypothetical protein
MICAERIRSPSKTGIHPRIESDGVLFGIMLWRDTARIRIAVPPIAPSSMIRDGGTGSSPSGTIVYFIHVAQRRRTGRSAKPAVKCTVTEINLSLKLTH